LNSDGVICNKY